MRLKTMLISMAWASTALAGELPPELPFQAIDGTSLTPYQEGVAGDLGARENNQIPSIHPNEMNDQVVDRMPEAKDQNQMISEQATQPAPAQTSKLEPKPKKKPRILNKAPKNARETTQAPAKNKEIDLGLQSSITIKPKPGRTESVVIAKGKLNRIVTPYAEPKVLTVDNV